MKQYVCCLFLGLMMSGAVFGTTLVKEEDESILQRAQYVLTGNVERVDTTLEKNNMPFEYTTIKIAKIYKNNDTTPLLLEEKIIIRQIGGTVNGITVDVAGLTKFVKDNQMFLSLSKDEETGYFYVVASVQGAYYMANNSLINDTRANGLTFAKVSSSGQMAVSTGEVKELTIQKMEDKIRKVAAKEAEAVEE